MVQKIIKVGSSAAVTIPKKQLDELGLTYGDNIEAYFKKPSQKPKLVKLSKELDGFMARYDTDLKNLAKR